MSFFQESGNELGNPIDMLIMRPGSNKRLMPKQLVLSSAVHFVFLDPTLGPEEQELQLFEAETITKTKKFTEKKNFKPFGYSSNIVLTKDEGWDIKISGKKTDAVLNALIFWQEKFMNGESNVYVGPTAGMKPQFSIRERVEYLPDSKGVAKAIEEYIYKDVVITGYEESAEDNASPLSFSLTCFSPYRECTETINEVMPLVKSVSNIIDDLLNRNKQ